MTVKIDGTNTEANPAFTGADTDTGLQCGTNELKLVTGGSARATVDSSGRLLLGTSSVRENFYNNTSTPTRFQLEGTSFTTSSMAVVRNSNNASDAEIIIGKTRSGSVGGYGVVQSGDHIGAISFQGADGSELVEAASILAAVDGTPGSNDMPGRLLFSTTADGASSPTERLRITSDGTLQLRNSPGIDFSQLQTNASGMTSETLDSYEEGTWTPTLTGSSSAPSLTYSTQLGEYVKIGSVVHLTFFINVANVSAQGGGQLRITGLPFSSKNSTGAGEVPGLLLQSQPFTSGNGSNRHQMVRTAPNQAQFYVLYKDLTTGQTHIDNTGAAQIGTGYFIGSCTYRTN